MAMVRAYEDDDYRPEYSLLVILDPRVSWDPHEDPQIPRYRDRGDMPTGSFAATGAGWITCQASGEADHEVRLELHDAPPPADLEEFDEVMETPYRSSSGGLTLTSLTGGAGRSDFDLGDDEWFRLRLARRRVDTKDWPLDHWLLRFWPDPKLEPPVWLARSTRRDYRRLAEDVEAVLRWTPQAPLETTSAALAERLLLSEPELRDALAFAEQAGLLYADSEDPLRLWPGSRPSPEQAQPTAPPEPAVPTQQPAPAEPALPLEVLESLAALETPNPARNENDTSGTGFVLSAFSHSKGNKQGRDKTADLRFGSPPRAGLIETDGTVVIWRDGVRVELARLGRAEWQRAWETRNSVLVHAYGRPALQVSLDGDVTELDEVRTPILVMGDGLRVVVFDSHHRRRVSRYWLRVVDLANGSVETMPWPHEREINLIGAYRDTVFFNDRDDPAAQPVTMRWTPGTEPERYEHRVTELDPLTGTTSTRTAQGVTVYRPDGMAVTVPVPREYMTHLAPGGNGLWTMRGYPPELMLFPVEAGPEVQPKAWKLPWDGHSFADKMYGTPIWEDMNHVLLGHQPGHVPRESGAGVRLSVPDGAMERLPPMGSTARTAMLIKPLLTP